MLEISDVFGYASNLKQWNRFSFFISAAGIRKVQRVSDVNAMGYVAPAPSITPDYVANTFVPDQTYGYGDATQSVPFQAQQSQQQLPHQQQQNYNPNYANPGAANYYDPYSSQAQSTHAPAYGHAPQQGQGPPTMFNPNSGPANVGVGASFAMLNQPVVQDMALQYGQKLADQGKQLVESHLEKYVPVTRLKYYFAVDNNYVVKKLLLLLFPFTHKVGIRGSITWFAVEFSIVLFAFFAGMVAEI